MLIANLPNLKITVSNARKVPQLMPLLPAHKHLNDLDTKRVIVVSDESIQQEKLTHRVREP